MARSDSESDDSEPGPARRAADGSTAREKLAGLAGLAGGLAVARLWWGWEKEAEEAVAAEPRSRGLSGAEEERGMGVCEGGEGKGRLGGRACVGREGRKRW